jgi:DNA invertase Pin-like site-specific DNA recombinase
MKNGKKDISLSIENQQAMLEAYVDEKDWSVYKVYVDDDITGTTFNRPGFQSMMGDIESGRISCIITKDLSRLGRNYIEAGRHRELFNEYGVRYIAIHDNHDSLNDDYNNISTPIKEIMNEMYAADISRKVRSTKRLMAKQGKFSNSRAPYGYMKAVEDKHVLVVDENVSGNVVRIFELYMSGKTARAIADMFNNEGIMTANEYFYSTIGKPNPYNSNKNKWGSATIMNIIKNPAYYGAMANGKRKVTSFKNHNIVRNDFDDWIIIEDTHEQLISKELWTEAQKISKRNDKQTVRRSANGEVSIFAGIVKCANCGGNLVFNRKVLKSTTKEFFRCSTYTQKGKDVCPVQCIDYGTLYQAVLSSVQMYAVLAVDGEKKLISDILKVNGESKNKNVRRHEKTIRESKNRIKEIDGILQNLYEDKIVGEVTADLFKRMSQKYSEEQTRLISDVEQLEAEMNDYKCVEQDLTGWIERIKECLSIENLNRDVVVGLIDRIEASEVYSIAGENNLDISISYKFGRLKASRSPQKKNRAC